MRTAYLFPAGIVSLVAAIAIVVAMVGTATAAAVSSVDTGSQDFRGAQDLGSTVRVGTLPIPAAAAVSSVDTGSQDFRGAQDFGSAVRVGTTPTISALEINAALQPGQTVSAVAPGNGSDPVFAATLWTSASGPTSAPQPGQTGWSAARVGAAAISAPKMTEALQPGQTVSAVAPGNGSDPVYVATTWTPALRPTSALQPGETDSLVVSRVASYDPAHEHLTPGNGTGSIDGPTSLTPASGPTSAPQPGQTGW